MWMSFAIVVDFLLCAILAVPTKDDLVRDFRDAVHRQDLQSILLSIEERLRNLDNIYSMHLSTTLEDKLEQYQRKLESIDTKIIRLESLVMLNLDKISENISTRNFKEDIANTNLAKKVDSVYEGISHRLNYMDRKFETSAGRMQGKVEATLTRLERMDESFTTRNEEVEIELADAFAAIDELKSGFGVMEENIVNNTNENFEISLKEQMLLMKSFNDKSNKAIQTLHENTTRGFDSLEQKIATGLDAINETDRFLERLKLELTTELNEYAIKVAEMNSENWKLFNLLQTNQNHLQSTVNSTKTEVQNGIRALMLLIGKTITKEPQSDQTKIDTLKQEMESNFRKVFSAQNLFMDSCYRLQMDESQIESKISDLLEKLIETFEKKTAIEIKDIKNLETIIKSHDSHISRNLYQTNTNVVSVYEKIAKEGEKVEQVGDHLNALFSLIQDTLADENGSLSSKNANSVLTGLKQLEERVAALDKQSGEIKEIVESRGEYFKNISQMITGMEAKVNTVYLYYYYNRSRIDAVNQNLTKQLTEIINGTRENETREERIQGMITEIFGTPQSVSTDVKCPELRGIIDVRSNFDCNETEEQISTTPSEDLQQVIL